MKRYLEIFLNLAFWLLSSWVIVQLFAVTRREVEIINDVEMVVVDYSSQVILLLLVGQVFKAAFFYTNFFFTKKHLSDRSRLPRFWLAVLAIVLLFFGLEWLFFRALRGFSLLAINHSVTAGLYAFYFAISTTYGLVKVWVKNEQQRQALVSAKKEAELNLLRAQLHPHFLFNTLNNLLSMAEQNGNAQLTDSIHRLSGLLRYLLYDVKDRKVALEREIEFVRDFIELHLIRYGEEDELDLSFKVKGDTRSVEIEPGLLLPFVENAFKHGVEPEEKSFIHLEIDATDPQRFIFEATNSRRPVRSRGPHEASGIGLTNIRERLQLVYPDQHRLDIDESEGTFRVRLILMPHASDHR